MKMKRLENNTGTITKLSGNRSKPYIIQTSMMWDVEAEKYRRAILGYASTYIEALKILGEYKQEQKTTTFKALYKLYLENLKVIDIRKQWIQKIWNYNLKDLHNIEVNTINFEKLQEIMDSINTKSTQINAKLILTNIYNLAIKRELVQKNIAELLEIKQDFNKYTEKRPLTREEITEVIELSSRGILWAKIVKIMLYTGMRINEACSLSCKDILYDGNIPYVIIGSKTESGKNRTVPIHPRILSDVKELTKYKQKLITDNVRQQISKNTNYSSHCCRVTFISELQKLEVTPSKIKKIVGHKVADVTDGVYTKYSVDVLYNEILKINFVL